MQYIRNKNYYPIATLENNYNSQCTYIVTLLCCRDSNQGRQLVIQELSWSLPLSITATCVCTCDLELQISSGANSRTMFKNRDSNCLNLKRKCTVAIA